MLRTWLQSGRGAFLSSSKSKGEPQSWKRLVQEPFNNWILWCVLNNRRNWCSHRLYRGLPSKRESEVVPEHYAVVRCCCCCPKKIQNSKNEKQNWCKGEYWPAIRLLLHEPSCWSQRWDPRLWADSVVSHFGNLCCEVQRIFDDNMKNQRFCSSHIFNLCTGVLDVQYPVVQYKSTTIPLEGLASQYLVLVPGTYNSHTTYPMTRQNSTPFIHFDIWSHINQSFPINTAVVYTLSSFLVR